MLRANTVACDDEIESLDLGEAVTTPVNSSQPDRFRTMPAMTALGIMQRRGPRKRAITDSDENDTAKRPCS